MVIADEYGYPVLIDSIDTPVTTEYFWVLDLPARDFMLNKLLMLEEISTPVIAFKVNGYLVEAPADWNLLVYSPDTSQLDLVQVSELTKGGYSAFLYDHKYCKVVDNTVTVVDYKSDDVVHSPTLNKSTMLCHTVGPNFWICLSPTDTYSKFLKDAAIGDIL